MTLDEDLATIQERCDNDECQTTGESRCQFCEAVNRVRARVVNSRLTASTPSSDAWAVAVLDAWALRGPHSLPPIYFERDEHGARWTHFVNGFWYEGFTPAEARLAAARALVAEDGSLGPSEPTPEKGPSDGE